MSKDKNNKPMSKNEIIKYFSDKMEIKKDQVKTFLQEFVNLAYQESKSEKGFTIPGLGKLMCKDRKARMGRNPKTGETIKIKAKKVLKFRIAKQAKDSILGVQQKQKGKVATKKTKKK